MSDAMNGQKGAELKTGKTSVPPEITVVKASDETQTQETTDATPASTKTLAQAASRLALLSFDKRPPKP